MSADELRALLDHYVRCLNERRVDDLALIVADELTRNGERMTRQQWWDGPVGRHLAAVPDQAWAVEDAVIARNRIAEVWSVFDSEAVRRQLSPGAPAA